MPVSWSRVAALCPRTKRLVFWSGLGVSAMACFALAWAVLLMRGAPVWWRTISPGDTRTTRVAQEVENGVVSALHEVRPTDERFEAPDEGHWRSEAWHASLRAVDANAWLNTRLPKWFDSSSEETSWPGDLAGVQVEFDHGKIHVGAEVLRNGRRRFISATLAPEVNAKGELWMRARTVRLGRLPIPPTWVLGGGGDVPAIRYVPGEFRDMPETRALFEAFIGLRPLLTDAVLQLEDGRQVRLLSLVPRDGRLEFTCRTEVDPSSERGELDAALEALGDVASRAASPES